MSRRKEIGYQVGFWCVIALALTAENWMDLLCRVIPM